jgi:hypothetical protein
MCSRVPRMQLWTEEWFARMVDRQVRSAGDRLPAVFIVTEQWIAAPGMREQIGQAVPDTRDLRRYLTATAISAGAANPAGLATQLLMLLQGAIAEELRNPEAHAMRHAAAAARVVVAQACRSGRRTRLMQLSVAAVVAVLTMVPIAWYAHQTEMPPATVAYEPDSTFMRTAVPVPGGVDPRAMSAAFSLQKKVEQGVCPAPHLMALPPNQVTAYMNVVSYRTPENPLADRSNLEAFLNWYELNLGRECYYPPIPRATVILR